MKKIFTLLCLLSIVLVFTTEGKAQSGNSTINPYLQVVLLDAASTEMIDVYATLSEQYSFDDLRQQTSFLPKKERQQEVVKILREYANAKQQDVRNYLDNAKQQNLVGKIEILWAANTVVFSAVPQVIYGLAENFSEIAEIKFDPVFDESLVTDPTEKPHQVLPGDVLAPQPGLVLINAPAVWAAGDSGAGVLAANHDSGCFWAHPDLINQIWHNLGEDFNNNGKVIIWNGSAWVKSEFSAVFDAVRDGEARQVVFSSPVNFAAGVQIRFPFWCESNVTIANGIPVNSTGFTVPASRLMITAVSSQ